MRNQGHLRAVARYLILAALVFGLMAGGLTDAVQAQTQPTRPKVLLLHSYHHGLSWTDSITRALWDVLDPNKVELYIEYMDTKRYTAPGWDEALYQLYRVRYANAQFDAIIVSDNFAFNFMRKYGDMLFPGVPVVFCGINFFNVTMVQDHPNYTGVVEDVDFVATLDLALRLQPDLKNMLVINDRTMTGLAVRDEFLQESADFTARLNFELYDDFSMEQLLEKLDTMPTENTAILLILLNQDKAGQVFTYEEAIDQIALHARVPIYAVWDFYLGRGIVGGKLTNAYAQGETAARLVRRILDGESVASIPIVTISPNRYIFDYAMLRRYNLPIGALPQESQLINRPPSLIDRYRNLILPLSVILAAVVLVVLLQARELRRRRAVEAELRVANRALQATQASLEARVQERTRTLEERSRLLAQVAQIGRDITQFSEPNTFWVQGILLITERLGFAQAMLYLLDEATGRLVLSATTLGNVETYSSLALTQGLAGRVARANAPLVVDEPAHDPDYDPSEALDGFVAALVLPIRLRGHLIGVLELGMTQRLAQLEVLPELLQPLLDQMSALWDNARLYRESRQTLEELERLTGEQAVQAWQKTLREMQVTFGYVGGTVTRLTTPQARQAFLAQSDAVHRLDVPLVLRGQNLGYLALQRPKDAPPWTEEERAMAMSIMEQTALALDNARLIAETRARAARESTIAEVTARLRASADVERVLQLTIRELGRVLNATGVIRLGVEETSDTVPPLTEVD